MLKGQLKGNLGPETPLALDSFPYVALSKVIPPSAVLGATLRATGLWVQTYGKGCQRALHMSSADIHCGPGGP